MVVGAGGSEDRGQTHPQPLYLLVCRAPGCSESLYILAEGASVAGVWGVTGRWGHIDSECTHVGSQLAAAAYYLMARFLHQC